MAVGCWLCYVHTSWYNEKSAGSVDSEWACLRMPHSHSPVSRHQVCTNTKATHNRASALPRNPRGLPIAGWRRFVVAYTHTWLTLLGLFFPRRCRITCFCQHHKYPAAILSRYFLTYLSVCAQCTTPPPGIVGSFLNARMASITVCPFPRPASLESDATTTLCIIMDMPQRPCVGGPVWLL